MKNCLFFLLIFKKKKTKICLSGYIIPEQIPKPRLGIILQAAFLGEHFRNLTDNYVYVYVQLVHIPQAFGNNTQEMQDFMYHAEVILFFTSLIFFPQFLIFFVTKKKNLTEPWKIPVAGATELDTVPELRKKHTFEFGQVPLEKVRNTNAKLRVVMTNNIGVHVPVNFAYDPTPIDQSVGIIYATIILLGLYVMIIWEVSFV